jgi:hypothetical protein
MPTLNAHAECISDLAFDTCIAGELPDEERRALEVHLGHCTRCRLQREVFLSQRAVFLERVPSWDAFVRRSDRWSRSRFVGVGGLLVAAAALLLVNLPKPESLDTRSKGRGHFGVFVKHGERVTRALHGEPVRPGDYLRFTYSTPTRSEFAVLHRDARSASVYYPLGASTVSISPGRDVALDFSIRLDDEPGEELLYGLFCDEPTALEPLRATLEATGELTAPAHCRVEMVALPKQLGEP